MDLRSIVERLIREGDVDAVRLNRAAQFGTTNRNYLGATILPEREVPELEYTEDEVRFNTVIANDGTRYSPAQLKEGGALYGTVQVQLGHSDIARKFDGRDYDGLVKLIRRRLSMEAALRLINWLDVAVNLALIELNEKQRWQAMIDATVVRRGDNGFAENVYYPNPTGHRVNAGGDWSDPTYDPWPDLIAQAQFLQDKGFTINRMITSRRVIGILAANPLVAQRAGVQPLVLNGSGNLVQIPTDRIDREALDRIAAREQLPPFETYDLTYKTQVGQARFMANNVVVMVCTTGRDEEIATEQELILVQNTLGYVGLGPAVGQETPGRAVHMQGYTNKPPRVEAEGWQASLPVILDPEAIGVIKNI